MKCNPFLEKSLTFLEKSEFIRVRDICLRLYVNTSHSPASKPQKTTDGRAVRCKERKKKGKEKKVEKYKSTNDHYSLLKIMTAGRQQNAICHINYIIPFLFCQPLAGIFTILLFSVRLIYYFLPPHSVHDCGTAANIIRRGR